VELRLSNLAFAKAKASAPVLITFLERRALVRPRGGEAEDESGDGGSESRFWEEAGENDSAVDDSAGADAYERGDDAGGGDGEVSKSNSSMVQYK
jgi:hypothetical protein